MTARGSTIESGSTVLIVHHHDESRDLIQEVMQQAGFNVFTSADGREAFEICRARRPEVVVAAISLPGLDGPSLTRLIRAHRELGTTPLLLTFTAATDGARVHEALAAGADEAIELPAESLRLVALVARLAERRRATDVIQSSEARLRLVLDSTAEAIFALDTDGRCTMCNEAAVRLFGYDDSTQIIGRELHTLAHHGEIDGTPDPAVECRVYQAVRGGEAMHGEVMWRRDGTSVPVEYWSHPVYRDGELTGAVVSCFDITLRRQAEQGLRLSESTFRALVEHNSDAILVTDREGVIQFASESIEQVAGVRATHVVGRSALERIHPDDLDAVRTAMADCLREPGNRVIVEYRARHADGTWRHREASIVNRLDDPAVAGLIANYRDTTRRKEAEENPRRTTERLQAVVSNVPIALWAIDRNGVITLSEGKLLATVGAKPGELVGRSIFDLYRDIPDVLQVTRQVLGGESTAITIAVRGVTYESRYVPVRGPDNQVTGAICVAIDVTERVRLEAQLRQSQKLEAIGRLAAGVAHDFNNLLTAILGFGEMAAAALERGHPVRADLAEVITAGRSAAALTRQLLAFSRKQIVQPQIVDLNGIVDRIHSILRRTLGDDVQMVVRLEPRLGRVRADVGQLEQVIMNLAVNAREAMPSGGVLTIETGNVDLDERYAAQYAEASSGAHVMLAVSDTGIGMNADVVARLFEPFFTTKDRGTGLGLATVYGIVKQSDGWIGVDSEPGLGTTFKIYLPRTEQREADTPAEPDTTPSGGDETVLLVEDQAQVRSLARTALARGGYTVLEAGSGIEALDIVRQYDGPIHLLLTDVVMPGLSGRDVAQHVCAHRPNIRVIYMSGYADGRITDRGPLDAGATFIQKPFTPAFLLRTVRDIFDES